MLYRKNGKPANTVEIKATRSVWNKKKENKKNKQTNKQKKKQRKKESGMDKRETDISLSPPECPFQLYYDDLK